MLSHTAFRVEEVEVRLPRLSGRGSGLTLAHLSDLHIRRWGGEHDRLVEVVRSRRVDMVLLTGDFLGGRPESLGLTCRLLEALRCEHGVFVCRGNWEAVRGPPVQALCERLSAAGAQLLVNESRTVRVRGVRVCVAGVDDLWRGSPDFDALSRGLDAGADCTVLLSHAPLAATMLPPGSSVDVVLSGHTHGGQIRLPWVWRFFLPPCHGGAADGLHRVGDVWLYVSRGFGVGGPLRVRFRCPAEVAFISVRGAAC